jgi:glycosyltransferase involved in cell wall biosynthesis
MGEADNNLPLISVITVCFNGAEFITQTIQSVLSQTYPRIEYIVIDGGSTDGTVEIIQKYASRLAYWHSKTDRGLAHAFNLGLAQAHGQWILFLHADDFFLEPSVVQKMMPYLIARQEADVVFGETILMVRQEELRPAPLRKIYGHPWRWQEFRWFDTIPHPSAFTNRRYLERAGEFKETLGIALDYELYLRKGKALRAHYIPIAVSGMREGGVSGKNLLRTFRESRMAQQSTKALPLWLAWMNFFWQIGRFYLGRLGHKLLDPFGSKISYPGRSSGKLLR